MKLTAAELAKIRGISRAIERRVGEYADEHFGEVKSIRDLVGEIEDLADQYVELGGCDPEPASNGRSPRPMQSHGGGARRETWAAAGADSNNFKRGGTGVFEQTVTATVRDVWGEVIPGSTVTLEVDGDCKIALVEAPGYLRRRFVVDFSNRLEVVLLRDPDQCDCPPAEAAGLALIRAKAMAMPLAGRWLFSGFIGVLIRAQADRAWFACSRDLREKLELAEHFSEAPDRMHSPPAGFEGWQKRGSFKSDDRCGLQVTLYQTPPSLGAKWFAELDIDLNRGIKHALDALVLHPIAGQPDPRIAAQVILLQTGLPIPFDLEVRR